VRHGKQIETASSKKKKMRKTDNPSTRKGEASWQKEA
jgi:hypothetical protein